VLKSFIGTILGKGTAPAHLDKDIPTRGTTVVVGKGFSRDTIPTIELTGTEWPTFKDENSHYIEIPIAKVNAMPTTLPSLVCLKAPSKPAIIVNVLEVHVKPTPTSHGVYKIEWVPPLSE
jgi:hypothetical protein